jgi:beta-lactamase regulating signal transducer with metallopeptidase domain
MRFYLVCSLALSLVLPFIIIPIEWSYDIFSNETLSIALPLPAKSSGIPVNHPPQTDLTNTPSQFATQRMVIYFILIIYLAGAVLKLYSFLKNLNTIIGFINKSSKIKERDYWIVELNDQAPAFSFFNYIFINSKYKDLSSDELKLIKDHEVLHVRDRHTCDILFFEIAGIVLWFNPLMSYFRRSIKEIHEYIVDERIAAKGESKQVYANLLLKLASDSNVFSLATSFTGKHIKRRILMITKQRTSSKHKLIFTVIIPITSMLLFSFSYLERPESQHLTNALARTPWAIHLELQKYCGVYLPAKPGPVKIEIQIKNHALVTYLVLLEPEKKPVPGIPWTQDPASWTKDLQFVSDHKFADSTLYKSANTIEFVLNNKNEVTGCLFTQREGLNLVTHEFKKKN